MNRKILLILLVLLAVSGAAFYYARSNHARALELTGIVTTDETVVSGQIQGQISQMLVREGDSVRANQLLAVIAPQELRADQAYYTHSEQGLSDAVNEAQAALKYQQLQTQDQIHQAEANLATAQAQTSEAEADLENARLNFKRQEVLYGKGEVSAQAYDQARTTFEAARAHLESLQKQVDAARATVALAKANAQQVAIRESQLLANRHQLAAAVAQRRRAGVRLGYTEIRAPLDGIISVRAALQGEVVNAGQPIVTLIDPDNLWVRADIEETYIDSIRLGDKLQVRFPSGRLAQGTVFYRAVDANFATQRDVSRTKRDIKTFEIRLRVDNSERRLYPGLTAYVEVPLGS
jgi:HlyD family secretion protein